MKQFNTYLIEKLRVSKPTYTLFPKTKDELKQMIETEIRKNGNKCSLNHIDVSRITDMSELFYWSNFNGDISDWDVHNVTNMTEMFYRGEFSGDISNWDVSNVKDMFEIFFNSPLENNPPKWFKI